MLISAAARKRWRVTMSADGVRFPLKYLPNMHDLDNPPPTSDYYFYTIFNNDLVVVDFNGDTPTETNVEFFGNSVPLIGNVAFDGELFDDLIDIGVALVLESQNGAEVVRQAEGMSAAAPAPPQ